MVTVTWAGLLVLTLLGNEDGIIVRLKVSLSSNKSLSIIETLNLTLVCPAENRISYGPES